MTLKEAQEKVDQWIKKYGVRYFDELTNTAILMEEAGISHEIISVDFSKGENWEPHYLCR